MKKNKKPKTKSPKQAEVKVTKSGFPIGQNLVALLGAVILLYFLIERVPGYNWLWNSLVKNNLEMMSKYPNLTLDQKFEIKEKPDAAYVIYLRNNTPDSSIILMPPKQFLIKNDEGFKRLSNRAWCTFTLYPRKLVYFDEKETDPNYNYVDYVAIFKNWGYDKVNYEVNASAPYNVIPINKIAE